MARTISAGGVPVGDGCVREGEAEGVIVVGLCVAVSVPGKSSGRVAARSSAFWDAIQIL